MFRISCRNNGRFVLITLVSSRLEVFHEKGAFKIFVKLTGKNICAGVSLNNFLDLIDSFIKKEAPTQVFCRFC